MFVTRERTSRTVPARDRRPNFTPAEQAAFELPFILLVDARALVELYTEKGERYLARYLAEENPPLSDAAQVAALLAERNVLVHGL
jgi:hypothetical protein